MIKLKITTGFLLNQGWTKYNGTWISPNNIRFVRLTDVVAEELRRQNRNKRLMYDGGSLYEQISWLTDNGWTLISCGGEYSTTVLAHPITDAKYNIREAAALEVHKDDPNVCYLADNGWVLKFYGGLEQTIAKCPWNMLDYDIDQAVEVQRTRDQIIIDAIKKGIGNVKESNEEAEVRGVQT